VSQELISRTVQLVQRNALQVLPWMMSCDVRVSFTAAIPEVTIRPEVTPRPDAVNSCQMAPSQGPTVREGSQVIVVVIGTQIEIRITPSPHLNPKA